MSSTGRSRCGSELQMMLGGPEKLRRCRCRRSTGCSRRSNSCRRPSPNFCCSSRRLILFIASWRDLRRALIMTFGNHDARLRTLRILNEIEVHLGNYLLTVTLINTGVGDRDRDRLRSHRHAQSGRTRRARSDSELHPDHRAGRDVRGAGDRRHHRVPDLERGLLAPLAFRRHHLHGRAFHHAYHHRPQARAECACRLPCARVLDLAVGARWAAFLPRRF